LVGEGEVLCGTFVGEGAAAFVGEGALPLEVCGAGVLPLDVGEGALPLEVCGAGVLPVVCGEGAFPLDAGAGVASHVVSPPEASSPPALVLPLGQLLHACDTTF